MRLNRSRVLAGLAVGTCLAVLPPAALAAPPAQPDARAASASGYRPAKLHLRRAHPYISLADYTRAPARSAIGKSFKSYVDRNLVRATDFGYTPADAVVMYARSRKVTYLKAAIAQVDASVRAAEDAIASGQAPAVAGDSYLEVGGELEALAFAYDYGIAAGRLSPAQQRRWKAYGDRALANVWNPRRATWGGKPAGAFAWSGWSIDNPGNNYFFSFLKATEMWALATHSRPWIRFLQRRTFPQLEKYYARLAGGGSREGTGYGTAQRALYEDVRMWQASTGERLKRVGEHARATIDYWIHATVPTLDMFASIGDLSRESMPNLFDYHENLVREAVALNPGTAEAKRGMWWIHHNSVPDTLTQGFTRRYALLAPRDRSAAPTATGYHAPGVGQYFARSSWEKNATWLNFTTGTYDETHAHEDQGAFQLYRGGWLAQTANIFSRSGLAGNGKNGELGPEVANVVRFERGGTVVGQDYSKNAMTVGAAGGALTLHGDLGPAYARSGGLVSGWTRDLAFAGDRLHVRDRCSVGAGVSATFQLVVAAQPQVHGGGSITAGKLAVAFDPSYGVRVVDMRSLPGGDFQGGWRIELSNPAGCAFDVDLTAGA